MKIPKKVRIMEGSDSGVVVFAEFELEGDVVKIKCSDHKFLQDINEKGIPDRVKFSGRWFTPQDGKEFMKNLPRAYVGSRFWAQVVE